MALSEEEQRLLAQMEAALAADDPKLANTMRGSNRGRLHRRRAALAGIGFFAGLGLLLFGVQSTWIVSVVGFILMFGAAFMAVSSWQAATPSPDRAANPDRAGAAHRGSSKGSDKNFMDKMEERWRRRQEDGQ